jgi:carbamoyl-phosphate synthase small subunit
LTALPVLLASHRDFDDESNSGPRRRLGFHGQGFGARASACGEVCFNTSMTGYQEILTDPSYKGQIVTMTYPLIGNYGVNAWTWNRGGRTSPGSSSASCRRWSATGARIFRWRSIWSGTAFPGIQGIDTRALTKKLRVRGAR